MRGSHSPRQRRPLSTWVELFPDDLAVETSR